MTDASGTAGPEPGPGPIGVDPTEPKAAFSKAGKGVPGTPVSPAPRAAALDALNARLNQLYDSTRGIASAAGALVWLEQQARAVQRRVPARTTRGRALRVAVH